MFFWEGQQELNDRALPNLDSLASRAGLDHLGHGRGDNILENKNCIQNSPYSIIILWQAGLVWIHYLGHGRGDEILE